MRKTQIWSATRTPGTAKSDLVRLAICALAIASFVFPAYTFSRGEPANPMSMPAQEKVPISGTCQSPLKAGALPTRFDLRSQVSLTPVREQGETGGCWAFASIATLETHLAFRSNRIVELSENNLMTQLSGKYVESFDRDADGGGDDVMAVGYCAACTKAGVCPKAPSGSAVPLYNAARIEVQTVAGDILLLIRT